MQRTLGDNLAFVGEFEQYSAKAKIPSSKLRKNSTKKNLKLAHLAKLSERNFNPKFLEKPSRIPPPVSFDLGYEPPN